MNHCKVNLISLFGCDKSGKLHLGKYFSTKKKNDKL